MHHHLSTALCIAMLALPAAQAAESVTALQSAADPSAAVPATPYNSAFAGYQSFREQAPAPWREVNDTVHKVGGHNGIFGGAARAPAAPAQHPQEHRK
jgi:hypothetical protein